MRGMRFNKGARSGGRGLIRGKKWRVAGGGYTIHILCSVCSRESV